MYEMIGWVPVILAMDQLAHVQALNTSMVSTGDELYGATLASTLSQTLDAPPVGSHHYAATGTQLLKNKKHSAHDVWSKGLGYMQELSFSAYWGCRSNWRTSWHQSGPDWGLFTRVDGSEEAEIFRDWFVTSSGSTHLDDYDHHVVLWGAGGDDTLMGDKGNDVIYGGKGNDVLDGGRGNDLLVGNDAGDCEDAMDILRSGSGSDTMYGQCGNDWLFTDDLEPNNIDYMYGGPGADVFVVSQIGMMQGVNVQNGGDLFGFALGSLQDVMDFTFAAFFPTWKLTKEVMPLALDFTRLIGVGSSRTEDQKMPGRNVIMDFNPMVDMIVVPLSPDRESPNVDLVEANNGENALKLTQDGHDLCYINWASPEEIFGPDADHIGFFPAQYLYEMLRANLKMVGGRKFSIGVPALALEDVLEDSSLLDGTEDSRFLIVGAFNGNWMAGSNGNDNFVGNNHPAGDILFAYAAGKDGGDQPALKDGNDIIRGFGGDDLMAGGSEFNQLHGGEGNDWASYVHARTGIVVDMTVTGEWVDEEFYVVYNGFGLEKYDPNLSALETARDGYDWLFSVENIVASDFDDVIIGNDNDNAISTQFGNDRVTGNGGADQFIANGGLTTITDFTISEGDEVLIDGEAYNLTTPDSAGLHGLVYYQEGSDLVLALESNGQRIVVLKDIDMSDAVWNQITVTPRTGPRTCVKHRDSNVGHCRYTHQALLDCKWNWQCYKGTNCVGLRCSWCLNEGAPDGASLPAGARCSSGMECCSGMCNFDYAEWNDPRGACY
eukprot:Clim_evm12s245 gene=Clim_evmTU12s245